jgi:hypothetical protein
MLLPGMLADAPWWRTAADSLANERQSARPAFVTRMACLRTRRKKMPKVLAPTPLKSLLWQYRDRGDHMLG